MSGDPPLIEGHVWITRVHFNV